MLRLHLLAIVCCLGLLPSVAKAVDKRAATVDTLPWFQRCLVGMEVGPTGAQFGYSDRDEMLYASRFNGRDITRLCRDANVEYLVIWARDGDWAYYNSQVVPKCPGLGERDVLRETMEEARPHQLPVIAYCVVQQGGNYLKDHPEFAMVCWPNSSPTASTASTSTCSIRDSGRRTAAGARTVENSSKRNTVGPCRPV